MITNLRRRFITVTMLSVVLVLFLLMGVINLANYRSINRSLDMRMDIIEASGGRLPDGPPNGPGQEGPGAPGGDAPAAARVPETSAQQQGTDTDSRQAGSASDGGGMHFDGRRGGISFFRGRLTDEALFDTRYFTVTIDASGAVCEINAERIATVTEEQAGELALSLYNKERSSGYKNGFRFRAVSRTDDGESPVTMYIFLSAGRELDTLCSFLIASVAVSIIGTLLIFLLVVISSKLVFRPVAESYEKQKRFITDASHEIKTPLAIIGANIEVVEMENGESEWTKSIRHQIARLSSLTEKLVFLSRMDEEQTTLAMTDVNLSDLVTEAAEGFAGSAQISGRTLTLSIAPDLTIRGDAAMLSQLVSLLLDNAMKYASEESDITLSLEAYRKGRHTVRMVQTNTADGLSKGNLDVMFERFYRQDASRNSGTGGHGIGLSVAAAIVRAHGGTIHAQSPDGRTIRFIIII